MARGRLIAGPFQRLIRAQQARQRASEAGNVPGFRDAEIAIDRAKRAINRWEQGITGSTRGLDSFVGSLARAGTVIGVVIAAFTGVGRAIRGLGNRFAALQLIGGSREEQLRLRALGAAAGLEESQLGQLIAEMRMQRGRPGGRAAAELGFLPSRDIDPFLNEPKAILESLQRLFKASDEAALALTKIAPFLAPFLRLRGQERLIKQTERTTSTMDRFGVSQKRAIEIQSEFDVAIQQATFRLQQFVVLVADFSSKIGVVRDFFKKVLITDRPRFATSGTKDTADKQLEAAEQQVQALNRNTTALNLGRTTPIGGGPRARGALPRGLGTRALNEALKNGSITAGGIDLFAD